MFYTRSGENASDPPALPEVDSADAVLRQVGEWLRQARAQRGRSLHDVANELRIQPAYLHGLEQGDHSVMPGRTYALGFLRSYALHLGYDGDDLVRRVKAAGGGSGGRRPRLSVPTPVVESRAPRVQLLVLSLVLASVVYGGWHYANRSDPPGLETVAEVPEELREGLVGGLPHARPAGGSDPVRAYASEGPALPPSAETAAGGPSARTGDGPPREVPAALPSAVSDAASGGPPRPAPADPAPIAPLTARAGTTEEAAGLVLDGQEGPDADEPLTDGAERAVTAALMDEVVAPAEEEEEATAPAASAAAVAPSAEAETGAPAAVPAPSATELLAALDTGAAERERDGRVYGRANRGARVTVEALETAWIQVRSTDSTYTYTRTLQPGDVYHVPNRRDLALWTGNAGGLRVAVDGRPLAPLGQPREVKRDIPLDPDDLLSRAQGVAATGGAGHR
ncbi:MAG TPA: helix-turn-helix domain-containing protein [Geminicoccaceae bacterium]|nr:helix-turn-helix domain-containing protein [Geminicoccaceae bacterium]